MRAYFNMPMEDFVYQLRTIAIGANARPAVIDMIDQLDAGPTEKEIEAQCEEKFDDGVNRGRETQWELCEAVVTMWARKNLYKKHPELWQSLNDAFVGSKPE